MYAEFNSDSYTVSAGSKLKVNIKGYSLMEHGLNDIDTVRANYMTNLKDVDIYLYENGELKKLATTNKKGNAKIKFSEEGEYTLVAVRSSSKAGTLGSRNLAQRNTHCLMKYVTSIIPISQK